MREVKSDGLDGADDPPRARQPKKPRLGTSTPAGRLLGLWMGLYKARTKADYVVAKSGEGYILMGIISQIGEAETEARMRRFFAGNDWADKTGYTLPIFRSQINRLVAPEPTGYARNPIRMPDGRLIKPDSRP